MKIEDMVFERVESVGLENLTDVERSYWLLWQLEAEANNGGLEQFIENSMEYANETIEALKNVKAFNMASLLIEAIALYKAAPEKNDSEEMRAISNRFTNYPDDLGALIDDYVKENRDMLLGPSTELELWESRKSRGKNIPRFVTKEIDYEKEALEDSEYSSRSCPECAQPVPDYRKTCKRCGFPIGKYSQP